MRCSETKESDDFYKDKLNKDGLKNKCKSCIREIWNNRYIKKGYTKSKVKTDDTLSYQQNYHKLYPNYNKNYNRKRRLSDPLFKLSGNMRNLIKNSFNREYTEKSKKTIEIIGINFNEFKKYIENQFTSEMNWGNYGAYWEIDHIYPISLAKNEEDIIRLNHYTNLRPLYKADNRSKTNKLIY